MKGKPLAGRPGAAVKYDKRGVDMNFFTTSLPEAQPFSKELTRAGIKIKVGRADEHLLLDIRGSVLDIRGKSGDQLFFHAILTPGFFPRFKKSIALAEKMLGMAKSERGSILQLVKSE